MAGQFAHIIVVNELCAPEVLGAIPHLTPETQALLSNNLPFCRLGAVSPDCPAMVGQDDASGWNGVMHYANPAEVTRYALPKVLQMPPGHPDTEACIAWLFGYAAHIVTDYAIHPIVRELVGDYPTHKLEHRICELHQDTHLFSRVYGKEIRNVDFKAFTELTKCSANGNTNHLHPAIASLWTYALQQYPRKDTEAYVRLPSRSIEPNVWYATYLSMMEHFATKGGIFLQRRGYAYCDIKELDQRYIKDLPAPKPHPKIPAYEDLFEKAKGKVKDTWAQLGLALNGTARFDLVNANLDTGIILGTDTSVYWS